MRCRSWRRDSRAGGARFARAGPLQLAGRLRARREEIEEALLTRTYAIADPREAADPEYAQGLRAAVTAALDYGLAAVERGEERGPPVPVLLLAQARLAARNGVNLDTVLRRYFAGYTLLGDFIVQEAASANLGEPMLKNLLRDQATTFDRFLATVTEEHMQEARAVSGSTEERRVERVRRVLDGELIDIADLGYDFDCWHLGVIAYGGRGAEAIRELAGPVDCRLLLVCRDEDTAWAWLGSRDPCDPAELICAASSLDSPPAAVAFGEPGKGLAGWRLSHRQAVAALTVAQRSATAQVRYGDVALLASMIQDDLLARSLRQIYLAPLSEERDGGSALRETLRAYFAAERSISSAAATLRVNRHTVTNRLRAVERRLGRSLQSCGSDVEAALRLDDIAGG